MKSSKWEKSTRYNALKNSSFLKILHIRGILKIYHLCNSRLNFHYFFYVGTICSRGRKVTQEKTRQQEDLPPSPPLALKPRADVTKPRRGVPVSGPAERTNVLYNFLFKRKHLLFSSMKNKF